MRSAMSTRVWNFMASDYAFHGAFRYQNTVKLWKATCFVIGCGLAAGGAIAFSIRMQPAARLLETSVNASPKQRFTERFGTVGRILSQHLQRNNLHWSDVVSAANRLAPIESHIVDAAGLVDRVASSKEHITRERLEFIIKSIKTGHVVRRIALEVTDRTNEPADFTEHLIKKLVDHWIAMEYFNPSLYPQRDVFGSRQTSEAIGVDIGSTATSALSDDTSLQELPGDAVRSALEPLQQFGFVYIRGALSFSALTKLRESLGVTGKPSGEVGTTLLSQDANISHSRASPNRLQLVLRGSKLEDATSSIHSAIVPLITALYDRRGVSSRLILSDVRLVVVDHAAHQLSWTAYNPRGGFSVMIPLQNNDCRSGSQAFLPGSHMLFETRINVLSRIHMFLERYMSSKRPTLISDLSSDGTWRAGDAFVFDNRLIMRGTENKLFRSGSYILAKYETMDESPEALSVRGKLFSWLASLLEGISHLT